jgi:GTPase SAR1 family protein
MFFFLIGNKCDLNDNQRKISYEEGEKISKELNLFFMEVSAKKGQNINLLFEYMTEYLCKNVENSQIEEENLLCNNSKNNFNIAYNTLNELIKNENKKKIVVANLKYYYYSNYIFIIIKK